MNSYPGATAAIASARRTAAADRHLAMRFDVELRPLAELSAIAGEWRALADQSLEPNVFYEPGFALAAAPLLGKDVRCALVWSQTPRRLVGLFPVRIERRRYGVPFPLIVGWTHPYAPLGTPLVDREMAEPVIAAWLDRIATDGELPDLVLMPLVAQSGPFASILADLLASRGGETASFDAHERALFLPGSNRADYFQSMNSKRRRNIRRRERKLEELGGVTTEIVTDGDAIAHALADFFQLEADGWKGRAGTAATQDKNVRRFLKRAVTTLGAEHKALIYRLIAEGRVIGTTIGLKSGDTAWGWKVAYDEAFGDYSPGVLAVTGLTRAFLDDPAIMRADSCTSAADTMASQLWNERLTIADLLFSTTPDSAFSFGLASRFESLRRSAIATAKSARDHLRRR